jgi:hypothetical protein
VREVHPFTKMKFKKFIRLACKGLKFSTKGEKLFGCIIHCAAGGDL